MKKILFILFISISLFADTDGNLVESENITTYWSAKKEGKVKIISRKSGFDNTISVTTKNNKVIVIVDSYPKSYSIKWHNNHLVQIYLSCGTGCSNSTFVNIDTNEEAHFPLVLAVDKKRDTLAYTTETYIAVTKIFNKNKIFKLKRDFSPVAALYSAINKTETEFTPSGNLIISYQEGKEYREKKEEIKINDNFI